MSSRAIAILDYNGKGRNDMGNFDECVDGSYSEGMHYCLAQLNMSGLILPTFIGFCVPEVCDNEVRIRCVCVTFQDLIWAADYLLSSQNISIPGLKFNISCSAEEIDWTLGPRISWVIVAGIFLLLAFLGMHLLKTSC